MAKAANKQQVAAAAAAEQAPSPQGVEGDKTVDQTPTLHVDGVGTAERVLVKTMPGVARFCRAGLCFGPDPTELVVAELADGVLEALLTEPRLVVTLVVQAQAQTAEKE